MQRHEAKRTCKQKIVDAVATLEGTWDCQPAGNTVKERIFLKKAEHGRLVGVYENEKKDEDEQAVFGIRVRQHETKLVPNMSRRKRKRHISVLTSLSSDQLTWKTSAGVRVTWIRANVPAPRLTRHQWQRHLHIVSKLTKSRQRTHRTYVSRHKCCCLRKDCKPVPKFAHKSQKRLPTRKPTVSTCKLSGMRLTRSKLHQEWIWCYRRALGLPMQDLCVDGAYKSQFVNHHHWPEKFWFKYIDQTQFPKWIPLAEAQELGMYVHNNRMCRQLRFHNSLPEQCGEYVFCVPWVNNHRGDNAQRPYQVDSKAQGGHLTRLPSTSAASCSDAEFCPAVMSKRRQELLEEWKQAAKTPLDMKIIESIQKAFND